MCINRYFIEKKQLERIGDRVANGQVGRPTEHTQGNGDDAMPTDRPQDQGILDGLSLTNSGFQNAAFDLEAIDNILEGYGSSEQLPAQLFSSFLAPLNQTLSVDMELINNPHDDPDATHLAGAVHESFKTKTGEGWLSTMHIAAQKGHEHVLRVLLEQGNMGSNGADSDGRTPLFYAALGGHESVVRLLLNHGSQVSHLDCYRRSVLHWAAQYRQLEVLRTLLEHWSEYERGSCDINAHDNHGWTPLHLAVERGFEEGVLLLIQFGADMNAKARKCWMTEKVIPFDLNQLTS